MIKSSLLSNLFVRFLLSGAFNTVLTYLLYLLLLDFFSYQVSYAVSYFCGVVIAYISNKLVVFKAHKGLTSALLFPLVYILQYLVTVAFLKLFVEVFYINERVALLAAIVFFVPINFALSKIIFFRSGIN